MSFYTAQVIADERTATVARENALKLAQRERGAQDEPRAGRRLWMVRLFRRTPVRRSPSPAPCPSTPAVSPSGC